MTDFQQAVIKSIKRMSHYYAWMTYAEIRRGIPAEDIAQSKSGKQAILSALSDLVSRGIVRHKNGPGKTTQSLWGLQ